MDISSKIAAKAYEQARPATAPSDEAGPGGTGFVDLATSFVDTLRQGEDTAKSAMIGDSDPQALVQALAATELAVETAVTIRDKVVEAYQEILRMPV